jgi:hypothetical protein
MGVAMIRQANSEKINVFFPSSVAFTKREHKTSIWMSTGPTVSFSGKQTKLDALQSNTPCQ